MEGYIEAGATFDESGDEVFMKSDTGDTIYLPTDDRTLEEKFMNSTYVE